VPLNAGFVARAQAGGPIAVGGALTTLGAAGAEEIFDESSNGEVRLFLTTRKFQPDGKIDGKGDAVYNATGLDQKVEAVLTPGTRRTIKIKIENDSKSTDGFTISGTGQQNGFSVRYMSETNDVTPAVTTGTLVLGDVPAGESRTIRMRVRANANAAPGTKGLFNVRATSTSDADSVDVVKASVRVEPYTV
jgi:uncharacterized membrane protein